MKDPNLIRIPKHEIFKHTNTDILPADFGYGDYYPLVFNNNLFEKSNRTSNMEE